MFNICYITSLFNPNRQSARRNFRTHTQTWREFVNMVEEKVVKEGATYNLSSLHETYNHMCKDAGEADDHRYEY